MSDENEQTAGDLQMPSELDVLKARARTMGITFSNAIGVESLRAKINAKLSEDSGETPEVEEEKEVLNPLAGDDAETTPAKKLTLREQLHRDNMKLVRCRITNLNPAKKELHGEIFTVGNRYLGTVTKFVPYGEVTENGYHLPKIIYDELCERKFLDIRSKQDRQTGQIQVSQRWVREFAIEVLDPLTPEELKALATAQIAAGSLDNHA